MGQLDDAAAAHRDALARLAQTEEEAQRTVRDARRVVEDTRRRLRAAMVAEAMAGMAPVEIQERSGYRSREAVRKVLRAGGVGP